MGETRSQTMGRSKGGSGGGQQRLKMQGMGLRAKFMLVMAGLTAAGMCILGFILAKTANGFVLDHARHQGIELAKMAAQVGRAVLDTAELPPDERSHELEARIKNYYQGARTWGAVDSLSFIDAIVLRGGDKPGFTATSVGNLQTRVSDKEIVDPTLSIPGRGSVDLRKFKDIEVYKLYKNTAKGRIPVYRFNVAINNRASTTTYTDMSVQVDVAIDTLSRVSAHLYIIIVVSIILMIALVMAVANLLAAKITHPVRVLMNDMRIVAQGNLDHRTKAHSTDEVGILAEEFNVMTQTLKTAQDALVEQEKARYELQIAKEVQQQLLPAQLPDVPGYEPAAFYRGAKEVSGDYYDFIPLGDGLWGFIVADVSGKGIPGSMVMAVTRTIIRLVATKHRHNAAETLKETNRLIAKQIKRGMFVTAFYAVLDTTSGTLTLASAGHNPMVVYRHEARKIELAGPKGIAIGFNEGPLFDKNVQQFQMQIGKGDLFAIYTDGFPEAMDEQNEEFGDEEFYKRIGAYGAQGAQGVIDGCLKDVTEHRGRAAQSDDLTMIVVRRV
ncbi:MAG: PP2C family protein-serine/threonine phosphatase [Planctomycetota bacterium]|nr:PP2C family protein-serine/threonine phosphatase [Planctomycetota bacterium]